MGMTRHKSQIRFTSGTATAGQHKCGVHSRHHEAEAKEADAAAGDLLVHLEVQGTVTLPGRN